MGTHLRFRAKCGSGCRALLQNTVNAACGGGDGPPAARLPRPALIPVNDRDGRARRRYASLPRSPAMSPRPSMLLVLVLAPVAAQAADPLADGLSAYAADARAVVAALDAGADPLTQADRLEALADQAVTLVEPFSRRRPACGDYLRAAAGLRERWRDLDVEAIERDYHHDAALPAIADPSMRAVCYQMKDLVVHPLTALRLLQAPRPDAAAVRHEVVEVVAHGQALAALAGAAPVD